jgi:hypothetical protein
LSRDTELVRSHNGLRRNRKALLAELSTMVKISKAQKPDFTDLDLDDLTLKALKLIVRAARFFDIWSEDVCPKPATEEPVIKEVAVAPVAIGHSQPLTPPADRTYFDSAEDTDPGPAGGNLANTRKRVSRPNPDGAGMRHSRELANINQYSRASQISGRPGTSQSILHSARPLSSAQAKRISAVHRISYSSSRKSAHHFPLVSDKLTTSHDSFLALLGSFIGLHLPSLSSTDILVTTHRAVHECKGLLHVVETVWERDLCRSENLYLARNEMVDWLHDFVQAASHVFQPTGSWEQGMAKAEDESRLRDATTNCVRGAGACVAEARFVLEKIGDFEFESEPVGLGISDFSNVDFDSAGSIHTEYQSDANAISVRPTSIPSIRSLSIPPQPTSKPPPPPSSRSDSRIEFDTTHAITPEPHAISPITPQEEPQRESVTSLRSSLPSLTTTMSPMSPPVESFNEALNDSPTVGPNGFRIQSIDNSISGSTVFGSLRDSERSLVSSTSTRATSPDIYSSQIPLPASKNHSFDGSQHTLDEDRLEAEAKIHEKTFAHELVFNKDGQITGGTLPALIERLTTDDATPDAQFVLTFYLTFRLFTTPESFAQALIDRFNYVDDSPLIAGRVWLRVFNVFKQWLELHWRMDSDRPALDLILPFAAETLANAIPSAGKRLMDLALKVSNSEGPLVPRMISSMGKTNTSIAHYVAPDTPMPNPVITKSQLTLLKNWKNNKTDCSILDFDPLELARQFTIKESQLFCSILPEELLATEWTKKSGSMAVNVRAMSTLSTDLANLVIESILKHEEPNKRAKLIKRWIKIADKCLELNNYDSLMAILCSLESTTILRMKQTWALISSKTKATLANLEAIVDVSMNYTVLRQRLQNHVAPCLPFVGIYLTDLTFVDVGNQSTRPLPGSGSDGEAPIQVINFDKHNKTAKIISDLQRFQIPYRLQEVPELQTWMQDQLVHVRTMGESNVQNHYRRSLLLEPRDMNVSGGKGHGRDKDGSKDKIEVEKIEKAGKIFNWGVKEKGVSASG